ncbi:hypothetical protein GCM10025867_06090 [Frondihabitans sucicola]|uniref:Uncharacterized protein n=1 Tax=Frondihabitans sucicola TaxID=1268041 RepID=A0ABN6XYB3_9MICO|nr:hypothetical protein GCM10025867_06090 [Frondihabitans sucicola]
MDRGALPQADEAAAGADRGGRAEVDAVVGDVDDGALVAVVELDEDAGGLVGVAECVGQGLLHGAVDGHLHAGVGRRCPALLDGHRHPGRAVGLDQAVEFVEGGLRRRRCLAVLAQDAEEAPHVAERVAPDLSDLPHGLARPVGVGVGDGVGAVREPHHDGETVRDDVVHLARDAGALRRRGEQALLVALAGELGCPFDQGVEVPSAVADVDSDQEREQDDDQDERRAVAGPALRDHDEEVGAVGGCRGDPRLQGPAVDGDRVDGDDEGHAQGRSVVERGEDPRADDDDRDGEKRPPPAEDQRGRADQRDDEEPVDEPVGPGEPEPVVDALDVAGEQREDGDEDVGE